MNIKLTLNLTNGYLKDLDGNSIVFDKKDTYIAHSLLLDPMYALPEDVCDIFMEEPGIYHETLKKIIFECSIEANELLSPKLQTSLGLDAQESFMIKRQFVICCATYKFSQVFYRDYMKSVKKSKFLSDIKVSLEVEKEPDFVLSVKSDAKECVKELKDLLNAASGNTMMGFIKGECNYSNMESGARRWFPALGHMYPSSNIASAKALFNGDPHKIGGENEFWVRY